ncbi:hypothetical protein V1512DRAFT_256936 [Lipomyces arxii]|uniref:uncharacterized protein n=1 Tax=Lipomyces arxii TaxID=56418 RepID=UPI0034CEAA77
MFGARCIRLVRHSEVQLKRELRQAVTRGVQMRFASSEINPSMPEDDEVKAKVRTGPFVPFVYNVEYINPRKETIARAPIYQASSSYHVAAAKRNVWIFATIGGYFSAALLGMDSIANSMSLLIGIPALVPLPFVTYFTTPYVHRIFRIYDTPEGEPVDVEKVKKNEEFLFECISLWGRGLYNCRVKLEDLRVANKRLGWVNLEVVTPPPKVDPETGKEVAVERPTRRYFYVADDSGGYKMERIWAIIERQSGIDNGRD